MGLSVFKSHEANIATRMVRLVRQPQVSGSIQSTASTHVHVSQVYNEQQFWDTQIGGHEAFKKRVRENSERSSRVKTYPGVVPEEVFRVNNDGWNKR